MEIQKIRETFRLKLADAGWDTLFQEFVDGPEFETLMTALKEANDTTGITPDIGDVFKAFYECPLSELKVVIIGQDPYPEENTADGIAFSCSKTGVVEPFLKVMFKDIQENVYAKAGEDWYSWESDLKRWSNQGVLLLNMALTTVPGKIGEHYDIWKPFNTYLFDKLGSLHSGLIYIFMGDVAKEWATEIPEALNHKFYCYHPASACYNGEAWESNDVFNRTNEILEGSNGVKIIW